MRGKWNMMDWEMAKWKQELSTAITRLSHDKSREEDFTNFDVCPANLIDALRDMGWDDYEFEDNGCQGDSWIFFSHYNYDFVLILYYSGYTFELKLYSPDRTD